MDTAGKTVVVTIAGRATPMRLVEWGTGSALIAVDDDGDKAVHGQKGQIIAYHHGQIVRRERVWTD